MKIFITIFCLTLIIGCGGKSEPINSGTTQPSGIKQNRYGGYQSYYDKYYAHGKKSYYAGLKPADNPYISNGTDAAAWLDGYMAGQEESKNKELK